ncbi:NADH-quinone oxidoreductase subunit A [Buchnera aphidicola (Takecallis arundicolens)]|uniref:NADH-quinone oxidoreductase subunit A n=1 Tax=Buchnera aphidicola TaxID=9 RepID=UPI003A636067
MPIEIYSFIFFILSAFIICSLMLIGGWLLGPRSFSRNKNIPFESGIISYGSTSLKWVIKFYLLAVFFVIFDVETLYLYAWIINVKDIGWCGFFEILIFVLTLLLTLFYLVKENIFFWIPKVKYTI